MKHTRKRVFVILLSYSILIFFLTEEFSSVFQNIGTSPLLEPAYATRSFSVSPMVDKPFQSLKHRSFVRGSSSEDVNRVIYLTFDDGPSLYTKDILHTLDSFQVEATFFLLEPNIIEYKEETLLLTKNQSVGCHGVSHTEKAFYKTKTSGIKEMTQCSNTLYKETGYQSKLIRTPYGSSPYFTQEIHDLYLNNGFIYWDWNIDSEDWRNQNNHRVIQKVIQQVDHFPYQDQPMVILFHEQKNTSELLNELLPILEEKEFIFKKINENITPVQFSLQK